MAASIKRKNLKDKVNFKALPDTVEKNGKKTDHVAKKDATGIQSKSSKTAVAAIDFGTTYSGFAFSWKHDWSKVQVISKHSTDFMSSKVPTCLLLYPDKSFYTFGSEAELIYTQMAESKDSDSELDSDSDSDSDSESNGEKKKAASRNCSDYYYFHRFKMLLHDNEKLHRNTLVEDITGKKMRAMDIFSISIKTLKNTMLETMNMRLADGIICEKDIDFVLTVPAIWGDEAKLFMREAAIQAGIETSQLTLALESEAASIYCQHMHLIKTDGPPNGDDTFNKLVEEGKKYMVVDLGGGTADITVHKQTTDGTLEELLPATGGPFGGTSVDGEYEKLLETIAGKGILKEFAKISMEDFLSILKEFEAKKREVTDKSVKIHVKIPLKFDKLVKKKYQGGLAKAIKNSVYGERITYKNNKLGLQLSEFEKLFKNAIDSIIKCVADIFTNKDFDDVKDVIMVGGFSDCKLIEKALREKFKTRNFIIPTEAGLAVLKGAVYFGHLPNAISRRAARYTYGIRICQKFKPGEDPEDKKITLGGIDRCRDVLLPIVKRGDRIEPGCEYPVVCQSLIPSLGKMNCGIYVSKEVNPKFVDEKGCRLLGKLTVQFPPGVNYAEIEEIIAFGETEITFRVRQLETGRLFETTFDMLDENNKSKK